MVETESPNHSTTHLSFPAGVVYLAPKQAATGTLCTRWGVAEKASRDDTLHMPHVDSCVIKKMSSNVCALVARVREMFQERFMRHHLLHSIIYFIKQMCQVCQNISPLSFAFMPHALQSSGSVNTTHIFHSNSVSAFWPSFHIRAIYHVWELLLHQEQTVVRSDCYSSQLCNILE